MSVPATAAPVPAARTSIPVAMPAVLRLAALFTFLTATMGAVVSATDSGAACPTWPGCRPGELAPPWAFSPVVEFTHRLVAVTAGPLILAAAVLAWRVSGVDRRVRVLPWVALGGAIAAAFFGRLVVLGGVPAWMGAIDLCCALSAMTAMSFAAVLAKPASVSPVAVSPVAAVARWPRVGRLAAAAVGTLIVMHVTGILTAGPGSFTRTVGWPIWRLIDGDRYPWLQVVRLVLAGVAAAVVIGTAVAAIRDPGVRAWGLAVAGLFAGEMTLGVVIRVWELRAGVAAAYAVLAVALLWCLGLVTAVALAGRRQDHDNVGGRALHAAPAGD